MENRIRLDIYYIENWSFFLDLKIIFKTVINLFKIEENEIKNLLVNKVQKPLNIHAWLTLPSMEIIDFSLPTTYCIVNKIEEGMGAAITKHYSELTLGMTYEPMLVGDEFLRKSGGLIELMKK